MTSFAHKLNHLIASRLKPDNRPYSNAEIGEAVGVSGSLIGQLRNGSKSNPTANTIAGLAAFFGVPPGYFFDQPADPRPELDAEVMLVATRAAGLSRAGLATVRAVVESIRQIEADGGA